MTIPNVLWCLHNNAAYVWMRSQDGDMGWAWCSATNGGNPSPFEESPSQPEPLDPKDFPDGYLYKAADLAEALPLWMSLETGRDAQTDDRVGDPIPCFRKTHSNKPTKTNNNDNYI